MSVIKLVEDYAVSQLRKDVRDSLMMAGEQAILLQLFHAGEPDAVPCPQCGDDIYNSPEADCTICYGTMFEGGVRQAMRVWALFTDRPAEEKVSKRGIYRPDAREIQVEAFPQLTEHDVVIRVRDWGADHTPATLEGFYMLQQVARRSLRTGSRFGQWTWDVVGQKAQLTELPPTMKMITQYPVVGVSFEESTISPNVAPPDTKVMYYPAPGPTTVTGNRTYAETVGDGITTTYTITHNLGTKDVQVTVINARTMAEVEADVVHTDDNYVTVEFGDPPPIFGWRVIVQGGS